MTDAPLPAIVVTTQLVPAQATLLIRKLPESATYMFPPRSSATPAGELNRALVPISSAQPAFVEPAIVLTTPFDLAAGPLFRARLLRLGDEEHVALFTMHHIISDGWSMAILVREVAALYEAGVTGRASPLAALPIQHADYSAWQRDWLRGEVLERHLDYWRAQLADAPAATELPADRPRPPVMSFRGAWEDVALPAELSGALAALSRREGATLFMTLLTAFQVLLHHYSAQTDIVIGSPIAGRNRTEIEGLIGFFVNTLLLRTKLAGNPTFRELLRQVRETALEAYAHQDVPFEKTVQQLQ